MRPAARSGKIYEALGTDQRGSLQVPGTRLDRTRIKASLRGCNRRPNLRCQLLPWETINRHNAFLNRIGRALLQTRARLRLSAGAFAKSARTVSNERGRQLRRPRVLKSKPYLAVLKISGRDKYDCVFAVIAVPVNGFAIFSGSSQIKVCEVPSSPITISCLHDQPRRAGGFLVAMHRRCGHPRLDREQSQAKLAAGHCSNSGSDRQPWSCWQCLPSCLSRRILSIDDLRSPPED